MDSNGTTPRAIIGMLSGIAVAALLLGGATASHAAGDMPCDAHPAVSATAPGLQVQVDPKTGTYSMPAPGTIAAPTEGGRQRGASDLVVTPGTSPAGGYKIRLDDSAASHQEQK